MPMMEDVDHVGPFGIPCFVGGGWFVGPWRDLDFRSLNPRVYGFGGLGFRGLGLGVVSGAAMGSRFAQVRVHSCDESHEAAPSALLVAVCTQNLTWIYQN